MEPASGSKRSKPSCRRHLEDIFHADSDYRRCTAYRFCENVLAANLGNTVSTETLLARGWADTDDADPSYVYVTMRRLRRKIERDPDRPAHLVTVRGVGYRLALNSPDPAAEGLEAAGTAPAPG